MAHPAVATSADQWDKPLPVVLTPSTTIKLALGIVVPILGVCSAGLYFYHQTRVHMDDPTIHLERGERPKLETVQEAKKARKQLQDNMTVEFRLRVRELKQDLGDQQKKQIDKLGDDLRSEQRRIVREIRRIR